MGDAEICLCTMRAPGDTKRAMIISATKEDESGVAGRGGVNYVHITVCMFLLISVGKFLLVPEEGSTKN